MADLYIALEEANAKNLLLEEERDQLRAELAAAKNRALIAEKQDERSRHLVCLWKEDREAQEKALSAMTAENTALAAHVERLVAALEAARPYISVVLDEKKEWLNLENKLAITSDIEAVHTALAATPAQSLAAHDAALLLGLVDNLSKGDGWTGRNYTLDCIRLEAARIEKEAPHA